MPLPSSFSLFPFAGYWWFYILFVIGVFAVLAIDLGVFNRKSNEVKFKEAAIWSAIWMSLSMVFAFGLWRYALAKFPVYQPLLDHFAANGIPQSEWPGLCTRLANQSALEFITGYIIEQSLSVDNLFVFIIIFSFFGIPARYQRRVLFFGILGALVFRSIFIAIGASLMQYHWVNYVFGAFLLFTGVKILFSGDSEPDPDKNPVTRWLRRMMPVTPELHGHRFTVVLNGVRYATPLLVCLVCMEVTDIVFAVDSVPAIFAVTHEPLIVFTSNLFAILGLRSLYFLLAGLMDKFWALKFGLGFILSFVGLKMVLLNHLAGGKFPIGISLGIIVGTLAVAIIVSLIFPKTPETEPAGPENGPEDETPE